MTVSAGALCIEGYLPVKFQIKNREQGLKLRRFTTSPVKSYKSTLMLILMKQLLSNITITVDMLMKCLALLAKSIKLTSQTK